jgi:hypothetical protein
VRLAARGARETDAGEESVADPFLVAQLRRQAREVHVQAALGAVALTGLALLIPS